MLILNICILSSDFEHLKELENMLIFLSSLQSKESKQTILSVSKESSTPHFLEKIFSPSLFSN